MTRWWLGAVAAVALAWTAWTCLTQVEPGERGVVLRFGRPVAVVGPGLYVGWPWGIDRLQRVSIDRLRRVEIGFNPGEADDVSFTSPVGQLLTGDHNLVNVQVVIEYDVQEEAVERFMLYGDQADALVARAAEAVLAEWVAGRDVDEVLLRGKATLPLVLVAKTQQRLAPYQLGVRIQQANVSYLSPPRQVKEDFEAVTRAQAEVQTRINESRQEAETRWERALAAKFDVEKETANWVNKKRALAQADAVVFINRLEFFKPLMQTRPGYLGVAYREQLTAFLTRLQETGRLRIIDGKLAGEIDIVDGPGAK